jgi:putative PIN family toxin of toxin-antitoxin system
MNNLAVFDTNILLDFYVFKDPGSLPLFEAVIDRRIETFATDATLYELNDVIRRPQFRLTDERAAEILSQWKSLCRLLPSPEPSSLLCRDPDDQKFIDLALSAHSAFLISKDKLVLRCRKRAAKIYGLNILPPQEFLTSEYFSGLSCLK